VNRAGKREKALTKRFFRLDPDSKDITVVFRWLVILVLLCFLFFSPEKYSAQKFSLLMGLIMAYALSNAGLSFLSDKAFEKYKLNRVILFVDIFLISAIMYFIKGFETDLYLVYFLIIFVAAMQGGGFRRSWVIGLVTAVLYMGLYLRNNSFDSLMSSYILLRIPFFFLVAVFSAYHSEQLRKEVSRRKEAEEKSGEVLQQYKTLVDTIPDIIFEIDQHGRFTFLSEAVRLAGYKPGALLGKHFSEIIHADDLSKVSRITVLELYKGKITGDRGAPKLFDERRTGLRMTRSLVLKLMPGPAAASHEPFIYVEMHSSGKWGIDEATGRKALLGSIGIIRDVTESTHNKKAIEQKNIELHQINLSLAAREKELEGMLGEVKKSHEELKKAQAQLLQSEKLASIGQLAAGIAHEVNNPLGFLSSNIIVLGRYLENFKSLLAPIRGLQAAVGRQDEGQVSEEAHRLSRLSDSMDISYFLEDADRLVQGTVTGVDRIKKIMTELKTFSRKDEGARQSVNLNDVVEGVLSIAWNEMKYKAELRKEYGQVPVVKCNPQQIGQVILNLLLNAVQALEGQGVITVRTFPRDGGVCLQVSDTGKGIPPELLDKIFEPFFTTKEIGKGTGLGLSISSDIVQKHKGKIEVASQEHQGTTFTVWLPLEAQGGSP
jgi:PAS domain S-box-containing protein